MSWCRFEIFRADRKSFRRQLCAESAIDKISVVEEKSLTEFRDLARHGLYFIVTTFDSAACLPKCMRYLEYLF